MNNEFELLQWVETQPSDRQVSDTKRIELQKLQTKGLVELVRDLHSTSSYWVLTDMGENALVDYEVENQQDLAAQLAAMTEERNQWERTAHGSLEAIERIAATLDIPTRHPDSAWGADYLTLEKAILEAIEDMAK